MQLHSAQKIMLLSRLCQNSLLSLFRLSSVIGLTIGTWALAGAIVTPSAQAYTDQLNLTLEREAGETYEGLAQRAEMVARTAAQQSFSSDILITEVDVTVLGQNGLAVVPILTMIVSRDDWRSRPDPRYWSSYFNAAKLLLELEN